MMNAQGGCLCGRIRFEARHQPAKLTICHCKFCQRATGGAYMVEPIFDEAGFSVFDGTPKVHTHRSGGSGKNVFVHFCDACGTKLFLTFERFEGFVGVYGGTFDDPDWYDVALKDTKHIFLGVAQKGTVIPAQVNTFVAHATENDGTPIPPTVFDTAHVIGST